jgi:hypothetical protein
MGSIRSTPEGVGFDVLGAPGERVRVVGWAARRPAGARCWTPDGGAAPLALAWDAAGRAEPGGIWSAELAIGACGFARAAVEAA